MSRRRIPREAHEAQNDQGQQRVRVRPGRAVGEELVAERAGNVVDVDRERTDDRRPEETLTDPAGERLQDQPCGGDVGGLVERPSRDHRIARQAIQLVGRHQHGCSDPDPGGLRQRTPACA